MTTNLSEKKKVLVGMSGGIDSSAVCMLLQDQGYEVTGITLRMWDIPSHFSAPDQAEPNHVLEARSLAEKLAIPHYTLDVRDEFRKTVVQFFIDEYLQARTPNPCVMCNLCFKWKYLLDEADRLGCDFVATGHYARIIRQEGRYVLKKGADSKKDQSYFLAQLSKEQLKNVLFPLGELTKDKVREIAREYDLITKNKKDSTGICFIGERNFKNFLQNYLPNKPGDIINIDTNEKVGTHIGLMHYTIGQRKGLNIGGTKERLFTVGKDLKNNILYVAEGENNKYLYSDSCIIDNLVINYDKKITNCKAKFRYRSKDIPVTLEYLNNNEIQVKYENGKSITPGQVCALYLEDRLIGSGIIKEVRKNNEKLWYLL